MYIKWLKCFTWKACMEIAKLLEENKIIEVRLEKLINFVGLFLVAFVRQKILMR